MVAEVDQLVGSEEPVVAEPEVGVCFVEEPGLMAGLNCYWCCLRQEILLLPLQEQVLLVGVH